MIFESSYRSSQYRCHLPPGRGQQGKFLPFLCLEGGVWRWRHSRRVGSTSGQSSMSFFPTGFTPGSLPPAARVLSHRAGAPARSEGVQIVGCPLLSLGCEVCTQNEPIRRKAEEETSANTSKFIESAIRDAHAQHLIHAPDATAKARIPAALYRRPTNPGEDPKQFSEPIRQIEAGTLDILGVASALAGRAERAAPFSHFLPSIFKRFCNQPLNYFTMFLSFHPSGARPLASPPLLSSCGGPPAPGPGSSLRPRPC